MSSSSLWRYAELLLLVKRFPTKNAPDRTIASNAKTKLATNWESKSGIHPSQTNAILTTTTSAHIPEMRTSQIDRYDNGFSASAASRSIILAIRFHISRSHEYHRLCPSRSVSHSTLPPRRMRTRRAKGETPSAFDGGRVGSEPGVRCAIPGFGVERRCSSRSGRKTQRARFP